MLELSTDYSWQDAQEQLSISTDKGLYVLEKMERLDFMPRRSLGFHFSRVFCAVPTWDLVFHECFAPSDSRISFFTSVLRCPTLGFRFSRVLCAVRLSDFVFHECFAPSDSRISFFTSVLRCPTLGFRFSRMFYAVPTWDSIFIHEFGIGHRTVSLFGAIR